MVSIGRFLPSCRYPEHERRIEVTACSHLILDEQEKTFAQIYRIGGSIRDMQKVSTIRRPGPAAVVTLIRPSPYPQDVRAKGWRFELDHERIEQSDTWALAPADVKPWLLMLWLASWKQTPCGSLPDDDGLIAARMGMPANTFQKYRDVLLRGWWLADDGRLYHDTIAGFVLDMMTRRRSEADRKARGRAKTIATIHESPANVQRDTRVIADGVLPESGTGTGTDNTTTTHTSDLDARPVCVASAKPTKADIICRAIKAKGVEGVNPSNPELVALMNRGAELDTFEAAAQICVDSKPPKGPAYLLGIVRNKIRAAAEIDSGIDVPSRPWDQSRSSIEAKGVDVGLGKWNENDLSENRETFAAYTGRVRRRVQEVAESLGAAIGAPDRATEVPNARPLP